MTKRILFTDADGNVNVLIPSPRWEGTLEELAKKDIPAEFVWRIVDVSDLPTSRNYRGAWTDSNTTKTVDIDLEKAKPIQRAHMVQKALERVEKDDFGAQDMSIVKAEIEAINLDGITTLDELYNTFPKSIDKRLDEDGNVIKRKYNESK